MAVTVSGLSITTVNSSPLPAITSVIGLADSHDKTAFTLALQMKEEPMDVESVEVCNYFCVCRNEIYYKKNKYANKSMVKIHRCSKIHMHACINT